MVSGGRPRRGDVRADGLVFSHRQNERELWVTPARLEEMREAERASQRRAYRKNAEKRNARLERNRKWRAANRDWMRDYFVAYYQEHKADFNRNSNKRRAIKTAAMPSDYTHEGVAEVYRMAERVTACMKCVEWQVDHILPLAAGGEHHQRNLQILPARWNARKNDNPDYPLPDCYWTYHEIKSGPTWAKEGVSCPVSLIPRALGPTS